MAKVPLSDRPATAQWLIRARGEMTQPAFLDALRAEMGKAPDLSTYRGWESGRLTPRSSNLANVVAFWERRGVPGPDAPAPAAPEASPSLDVVGLVHAMTAALLAQTQALTDLRRDLNEARSNAVREREAMTDMLGRMERELLAIRQSVETGAGAAGRRLPHAPAPA